MVNVMTMVSLLFFLLTHDGNLDRIRDLIAFHVGGLACVASRLLPGHLLQNQALVRYNDPSAHIVHYLFAL